MPMIPQFQGGVPQVQDAGNAGISPARLPAQTFDYGKVMETAMKPVQEFANSFTKTMEVERARMIKAESDDAERQVITLANDVMMGESGYLKQQGKNADDAYDKSMEGLKTGVESILGGLSPQAREAVQSRVEDRVLSTVTQANRHRFAQRQQYQLGSAKSSIELDVKDFSIHWGDAEYQAKTLGSINQQIDYIANLQGWDDVQKEAYRVQVHSLAYSSMYQQWAESDPVGALAGFYLNKGSMDPNVALKVENQLFSQSMDLLALSLAGKAEEGFVPSDYSGSHNTKLSDDEEKAYQKWAKENGREKDVVDYDLRGAWKEMQSGQMSEDSRGHLGDKYKKPNHPTFSNQSIYSGKGSAGGVWSVENGKDVFTTTVKSKSEAEYLKQYFEKVEPNAELRVTVSREPSWVKNPLAPTGNAFIDSLPADRRFKIASRAGQLMREGLAEKRKQLSTEVKNSLVEGLTVSNAVPMTRDQFTEIEGEVAGGKQYEAYLSQFNTNQAKRNMVQGSYADNLAIVEKSKVPVGVENYAELVKQHESLEKACNEVQKAREGDAIQFGVDNKLLGFANINFEQDNETSIYEQLSLRAEEMLPKYVDQVDDNGVSRKVDVSTSAKWNVKPILLSKSEASQLVAYLDKAPIDKRVQMMKNIYNAVGDRGVASLAMQMKNGNADYALAMSAMGYSDKSGMSLGEISLLGSDAIKTKMVKIDYTAETGDVAMIRKELMGKGDVEGVFDNPQVLDASVAFLTNIFAYQRSTGGGMSYKKAVERAFGEIAEYNGKKIVLPRGVNWMSSFRSLVRNKGAEIAKGKGEFVVPSYVRDISSQQMGDMLKDCKLQSYKMDPDGGYQYKVLYEGRLVYTQKRVKGKDGSEIVAPDAPLVITLKAN